MFRVAMVVPTGVGAQIGGYAGDAGVAVRYLGGLADEILTHPNVVNAASFNVLPSQALYIEGHALDRFFQEEWAFQPVRSNRIGLVIDRRCAPWLDIIANAVQATAVSTGCQIVGYQLTRQPLELQLQAGDWGYRGALDGLEQILEAAQVCRAAGAEALAVLTWMDILSEAQLADYAQGQGVDPIGGLEALISHALVAELRMPVAHSPIFEPHLETRRLDPRVAAEEIGTTYLPCVLMGLSRAPRFVAYGEGHCRLEDISALVLPADACGGVPALVAAERGIPVIAVAENTTVLQVTLEKLGWQGPHLHQVANLWEAAGLLLALKQGLDPRLLRRPLAPFFQPLAP
ncbi:MAG: DUF3326 domain-containing protein [Candidatus Sericytochromatia bacterium]